MAERMLAHDLDERPAVTVDAGLLHLYVAAANLHITNLIEGRDTNAIIDSGLAYCTAAEQLATALLEVTDA